MDTEEDNNSREANKISLDLLPEISRERYETTYDKFEEWRKTNNIDTLSEDIFLVYFENLSQKYKSTTLWSNYSMLRSVINIKENIDISQYIKLRAFLKRKAKNYIPKKTRVLSETDFSNFLDYAPDNKYLVTKAVLAIGLSGACRRTELCHLKYSEIQDLTSVENSRSALLIQLKETQNKIPRSFTVTGRFYNICKKYISCRTEAINEKFKEDRFFLNYKNGKCLRQAIGVNKIGGMPKEIAAFLRLPNPGEFTGHCFRKSATTVLVNRYSGWQSMQEENENHFLRNRLILPKYPEENSNSNFSNNPEAADSNQPNEIYNMDQTDETSFDFINDANDFENNFSPLMVDINNLKEELNSNEDDGALKNTPNSNNDVKEIKLDNPIELKDDNNLKEAHLSDSSDILPKNEDDLNLKDEFYYFSKNIACQLRGLPLKNALICQKKITELLTEERITCISVAKQKEL